MKKTLSIALVALLATASVFAGLSGKAKLNLGYDFESESYGFSNGKEFALTMNIAEETKESVAEGDIYAGIKATMALKADDLIGNDAALSATYAPATLDVYYQYGEKQWISAQVKADLSSFNVPVALTVYGKDILNGKTFGGKVDVTVDAITASAEANYGIDKEKLTVKGSVAYKTEMFTAKAGVNFEKVFKENAESKQLYANASIESDAIISGATLALSYGPKTNSSNGSKTTNFFEEGKLGKVEASCTIAF